MISTLNFSHNGYAIQSFGTVDDLKIQRAATSLYEQVIHGSIKLGKVNRNHVIKTTVHTMKEDFNIDIDMNTNDNLFDYVAATFFQMYKAALVPHYTALLCPDVDTLKQLYPDLQSGGTLAEGVDEEIHTLLAFANEMVVAVQIFSPTMQFIVDLVTICVEGEFKKYINGSGATYASRRRFQLFRRFKPMSSRPKRRGSESSCDSTQSYSDDTNSTCEEKVGPVKRRSCSSICTMTTDSDAFSTLSYSNSFSHQNSFEPVQPLQSQLNFVPCVKPVSYVNGLFPQEEEGPSINKNFSSPHLAQSFHSTSTYTSTDTSIATINAKIAAVTDESVMLSGADLQEFIELFAGEADMDLDLDFDF